MVFCFAFIVYNKYVTKNINKILKYGSYFLVFSLPLFYIKNTFFPYTSPKTFLFYGIVEILTAFWIYALITDSSYRLNKKTLLCFLPLTCFIIWMTIAGILAVSPMLSFWSSISRGTGLLTLFHCFVFSLIISSLIKRDGVNYLYKLMHWFINSGFVLALSIWFGIEGFNILKDDGGGGLMGNSSFTATYLIFILAFGFFLFTSKSISNNRNKWWLGIKLTAILLSPIFINISGLFTNRGILGSARGAISGIAVGLVAASVFYLLFSQKKNIRILAIALIIIGSIVFSVGWGQLFNPNTSLHKSFVEIASGTRFIFADIAQESMEKHPWFGYGPENYMIAFQENLDTKMFLPEYNYEIWSDRAHNIYYDTGVSGGYPAIVFYALFIISIMYGLYKLHNKGIFNRIGIAILGGLVIGYVFQNLFVFDSLVSIMTLFVLAGIVFTYQDSLAKGEFVSKPISLFIKNTVGLMLLIVCSISLVFFVFRPGKKIFDYYRIAEMPIDIRASHYNDLLKGSSIGEQWDFSDIADNTYKLYNSDITRIKNDKSILPYAVNDIKALLQYAEKIAERNKFNTRLNISVVSLYNILNYLSDNPYDPVLEDHLVKIFNDTKIISPKNLEIYWAMAQVYMWKMDYTEVIDTYQKAIAIDPSVPFSHNILIIFAQNIGNKKLYNESLLKAKQDIPNFSFSQ